MIDNQEDRAIASHRSGAPSGAEPQGSRAKPPAAIADVTQADRDAAAAIVRMGAPGIGDGNKVVAGFIKGGLSDGYVVVQAFAKHRANTIESLAALASEMAETLKDCAYQAETRIKDGDEMGARVWRIALVDILAECRATLAKWEELNVADRP